MKESDLLQLNKSLYPIKITSGEHFLDQAIVQISRRFVHAVDPGYPLPSLGGEYPDEPWLMVFHHAAGLILEGRSGRIYFTERSFSAIDGQIP